MKIIILIIAILIYAKSSDAQDYPRWKFQNKANNILLTAFSDGEHTHSISKIDSCLYKIDDKCFYFSSKYEASFNGEIDSLYSFIRQKLNITSGYNIIPVIYLAFIVDTIGSIKYCGIYRGFNFEYDKAVLDIVSKMPNWKPAMCDGKTINSLNILKIDFATIYK